MKKTKIVCTIGPASESVDKLVELINAGMNVARLNFSHGDHDEHRARIENIREAIKITGKDVALLLDTKGPEIRTGDMATKEVLLEKGTNVTVSMEPVLGTKEKFSVTYTDLVNDVNVGSKILLDDGLVELEVTGKSDSEIYTTVLNTGILKSKKGVNVPNVSVNLPGITEKDANDIIFGIGEGIEFIAASFVRRPSDVLDIRNLLKEQNAEHIHILPKIENQEGVDNLDAILEVSDGLMVARGDLGVEIPPEDVPLVQKEMIKKCNTLGKPVITATQMLDSMQRNPRPTRAEASDVANAIFDGTDAIMLSGETAAGDWPVEAVTTMKNIAEKTETGLDYAAMLNRLSKESDTTVTDAIGQAVAHTALNLKVAAIVTSTVSGHTARVVSRYRPEAPIIAVTSDEHVAKKLSLAFGVLPVLSEPTETTDDMLRIAEKKALESGLVKEGDVIVISAGVPVSKPGTTNLMQVHVVGSNS
ncbi:pyruvate kinase [Terrilactibacillus sp. BCM23-1]|uniref:Pyruvate kinase n=1 Tax=Terrilactibacillus tamarindi TaxID=2599694 RepID=A0A6N8CRW6_9BACI|nr:pyruvate kinase [Terrilactibacillus tamarindi]